MNILIDELQNRFDSELLDQGWALYHKGLVSKWSVQQGTLLRALVGEHDPSKVRIDLEHFSKSQCSCGRLPFCEHMAAVILAVYTSHGRPELLLIQAKHAQLTKSRLARTTAAKERAPERPSEPSPKDLPGKWQRVFDQRFRGYTLNHNNSVEGFQSLALDSLRTFAASWDTPLRLLYELHIYLFVLRTLDGFHQTHLNSYLSTYHEAGSRALAGQCLEAMEAVAADLSADLSYDRYPKHWEETVRYVRELSLQGKPGPVEWMDVYRVFWEKLFRQFADTHSELKELSNRLGQKNLLPRQEDVLVLAIAHFDFMRGQDEEAMNRLERLHAKRPGDYWHLLRQLKRREDWERLIQWLRWLLPLMARMKQEEFHTACSYWVETAKYQSSDEEWIQVMYKLLPKSYYYYTDYLMNTRRYKQWIDLQLANGISPSNLYPEQIQAIESADPRLLLPLYHQSVERMIMEKNRASYLAAIREMRILLALYQKLGWEQRWPLYVSMLSDKFSRLRAFQQELKKGKWLS